MMVKMAATFQNGRHENIKQCIYLIFWSISMCNTCFNIGFQGQRIHFWYYQTQKDVHFQNDGNIIYTNKY